MAFQKVRRLLKRHFGSTRNFITWLILLAVVLAILNHFSENAEKSEKRAAVPPNTVDVTKKISPSDDQKLGGSCDPNGEKCPSGSISYFIKSGNGKTQMPVICFNGEYIIDSEKQNAKRGLNLVVINDKTLEVEDVRTFDTYTSDALFKRYLTLGIPDSFVVLVATFDDGSYSLSKEGRDLLSNYGSKVIHDLNFRDNFVMLGQRRLVKGQCIEKKTVRPVSVDFAAEVEIKGCVNLPVGKLTNIQLPLQSPENNPGVDNFQMGAGLINCGVPKPCDGDSFSVHMYTGLQSTDRCKICINGKYIFAKDLNHAGRGLNIAVISPKTKDVIRLGHFDTFQSSSTTAELFMEMLDEKDIVIAVTFDEASTNLDINLQQQFESLGSSMISRMSFRDAWVFVGQKGINGISPIEELSQAKSDWPKPIDKRICVPINLSGQAPRGTQDMLSAKLKFCKEHKEVVDEKFCSVENVNKIVQPVPLLHADWVTNDIFRVPIIIIPGKDYKSFQLQIESLFFNPGLKPNMINVIYERKYTLYSQLAEIYGVRCHSLYGDHADYMDFFRDAFNKAWNMYPYEKNIIFLEEEVIPTSDFLSFINRCLTSDFMTDNTLFGVSTWTPYRSGYGLTKAWYRTDVFPGLGFLMKRVFYNEFLQGKMEKCCRNRTWFGWNTGNLPGKEIVIPDAPRVYRLPYKLPDKPTDEDKISARLFKENKFITHDFSVALDSSNMISSGKYEEMLAKMISSSIPFNQTTVDPCLKKSSQIIPMKNSGHNSLFRTFSIFYEQKSSTDFTVAFKIAKCFDFHPIPKVPVPNLRNGLLRITFTEDEIMIIGSKTAYMKFKPKNADIIKT